MATNIHPTVVLENSVSLGESVEIGPYSVILGEVHIGDRTKISSNVRICGRISVGSDCTFYHGCCIGEDAQNWGIQHRQGIYSGIKIGSNNIFREYVTIHSSANVGHNTILGDHNRFMVGVHIAHDCEIGNYVTIANLSQLSGGAIVQDYAYVSAGVLIDSRVRIGTGAFVDASSVVLQDVPPFFEFSRRGILYKIRKDKMKVIGMGENSIRRYNEIYKRLWKGGTWSNIYDSLSKQKGSDSILREFLRTSTKGISCFRNTRSTNKDMVIEKTSDL